MTQGRQSTRSLTCIRNSMGSRRTRETGRVGARVRSGERVGRERRAAAGVHVRAAHERGVLLQEPRPGGARLLPAARARRRHERRREAPAHVEHRADPRPQQSVRFSSPFRTERECCTIHCTVQYSYSHSTPEKHLRASQTMAALSESLSVHLMR